MLENIDPFILGICKDECERLNNEIELIASENYPSQEVIALQGSALSVKYAEGYPNKRHYAGCENIDEIEQYAIDKACELFKCKFANVQPWSGSQANAAVYQAFCKPNDTVLSMPLDDGAHLTHGSRFTFSGKYHNIINYNTTEDGLIDYEDIKKQLYDNYIDNPIRLLVIGYSAYSRYIDFEKLKFIVNEYNNYFKQEMNKFCEHTLKLNGDKSNEDKELFKKEIDNQFETNKCILWCDMAHFAGFIASGLWENKYNPMNYCDVVTSTTHKTLRGPRGGLILWNNEKHTKKINQAVFPGQQGGPNGACIAAKAQCFVEALQPEYKDYMINVYNNLHSLMNGIVDSDKQNKIKFLQGGSDNHMLLISVKDLGITGLQAENILRKIGIICNKNMVKGDIKPSDASAIRIGTPAITTRGFDTEMCYELGQIITEALYLYENDDKIQELLQRCNEMIRRVRPFYR